MLRFSPKLERLLFAMFIVGILALVGMGIWVSQHYSLQELSETYREVTVSLQTQARLDRESAQSHHDTVSADNPISVHTDAAYPGYTLVVQDNTVDNAVLLDMDGRVVHAWKVQPSDRPSGLFSWLNNHDYRDYYWRDIHLLANGHMLIVSDSRTRTPYAYGIKEMGKDGTVIWQHEGAHHHVDLSDEHLLYMPAQKITPPPAINGITFKNQRILNDYVLVLSRDGREIKTISLPEAIARSPYREAFRRHVGRRIYAGDILHVNYVQSLSESMAAAFPMFKPGQLLVSMRNIDTIGVLDVASEAFVWMKQGPWRGQHMANFMPDGGIMLFDNKGGSPMWGNRHTSRIVEYYPQSDRLEVLYGASDNHLFYSELGGTYESLPNGNLLITETMSGHLFELTPDKKIAWFYTNPNLRDGKLRPIVVARRYSPEYVWKAGLISDEEYQKSIKAQPPAGISPPAAPVPTGGGSRP